MSDAPAPIRLFSVDLDGTLLGNPESSQRFKETWEGLDRENRPLLAYNSGRSVKDTLALIGGRKLPASEFVIGGVGTEFYDAANPGDVPEFVAQIGEGWNLALVEKIVGALPGVERQPPEFLHPYKSSWFLNRAHRQQIEHLRLELEAAGLHVNVVYSSLRHLDVLPSRANKGKALRWLCQRIPVPLAQVLVAGDTANDSSMFLLPDVKGIVVENAQPELLEAVVKLPVFVSTKIMDWLTAHDSNNDGLIEVPEAGDWTDLFGRSYHVLYDEVLWYRANVCFGRLLEYQRDFDRASDNLRGSQQIAGKIKASFWPSTQADPKYITTFADRQASLGDTQYLLAEITPFAFNWRCDVLENILAFLTNVIENSTNGFMGKPGCRWAKSIKRGQPRPTCAPARNCTWARKPRTTSDDERCPRHLTPSAAPLETCCHAAAPVHSAVSPQSPACRPW